MVKPDEIKVLQQLSIKTFYQTFHASNTEKDMTKYLSENFTPEKLAKEINNPSSEFYIVEFGNVAIGYLKINTGDAQTESVSENALEIERIYVLQEYHGKKVGQLLFDKAVNLAKERRCEYIWLGVWEENPRAIAFYRKNGFVEFGKHVFQLGTDQQTDILMKLQFED